MSFACRNAFGPSSHKAIDIFLSLSIQVIEITIYKFLPEHFISLKNKDKKKQKTTFIRIIIEVTFINNIDILWI